MKFFLAVETGQNTARQRNGLELLIDRAGAGHHRPCLRLSRSAKNGSKLAS